MLCLILPKIALNLPKYFCPKILPNLALNLAIQMNPNPNLTLTLPGVGLIIIYDYYCLKISCPSRQDGKIADVGKMQKLQSLLRVFLACNPDHGSPQMSFRSSLCYQN